MIDYTSLNLEPLLKAYDEDAVVKAMVGEVSGNGHQVFVFGIPAYLPKSQEVPGQPVETGDEVNVKVIKLMPETNNVVVSARVIVEGSDSVDVASLSVGDIVPVKVKNIVPYGVFVNLGRGVDGLIFLKELSYRKVHSAEEVVSVGDEFNAKITDIKEKDGKTRIELSLKQALPDPWDSVDLQEGQIVDAVVVSLADYGAFVNVGPVNAMLHRSELSWTEKNPVVKNYLSVGDKITVKIVLLDKENKKMAVSLREVKGNPWNSLDLEVGTVVESQILNKTAFGLFIGEPDGIQGLLHKDELAWLPAEQKALMDSLQVGESIRVVVRNIDKDKRKIAFSRKLLYPHPYDTFVSEHPAGVSFDATVGYNTIPGSMKIQLPIGQFQVFFNSSYREVWDEIKERFPVGGSLPVMVKSYDPEKKKIEFEPAFDLS